MRSFLVVNLALSLAASTAAAQAPRTPSRWILSAGPEWSVISPTWGMRVRADYDLVGRNSPIRFGLLLGGSWGPNQSFRKPIGNGSYFAGINQQRTDLMFGVTSALTPFPRARVSPYFTFGVVARQVWINGATVWGSANPQETIVVPSHSYGQITSTMGWGVRVRIAGQLVQVEQRTLYDVKTLTIGVSIPF